jgi:lysophospholipase L1-like esterase
MKIFHRVYLIVIFSLVAAFTLADASNEYPKVIAGFGSSVCHGSGDHLGQGGYIGRLQALLQERGWNVVDVSRGGDNTITINDRWEITDKKPLRTVQEGFYILPHKPGYVIIGLSLANEGIRNDDAKARDIIFQQFRNGMLGIIDRCRKEGMKVIVANCYPHGQYTPEQYDAVKRMNLLINTWNIPSINLLGSIDDGHGRWVDGFDNDPGHPNGGGHQEMFYAINPTLFDAIAAGKPQPSYADGNACARVTDSSEAALCFTSDDPMHSFCSTFEVRTDVDGILSTITGTSGIIEKSKYKSSGKEHISHQVKKGSSPFNVSLSTEEGKLVYQSSTGKRIISKTKLTKKQWRRITISHRCAQGETMVYPRNGS